MRELFSETQYYIQEFRAIIPATSQTARSIDENAPWLRIAESAKAEGFTSFACYLDHAHHSWAEQIHTGPSHRASSY